MVAAHELERQVELTKKVDDTKHEQTTETEIPITNGFVTLSSDKKFPLERRTLNVEGKDVPFDFLVIDSAEKWDVARGAHGEFLMETGQRDASDQLRFALSGLSLKEWEDIESANPIPSTPRDDELTDATRIQYELDFEIALMRKRVVVLEASTGRKIPGKTPEEKVQFLSQRNPRMTERLFAHVQDVICNLGERPGELLEQYEMFMLDSSKASGVIDFNSFDDWDTAVNSQYCFRMSRPGDSYILEFPIKGISQEIRHKIETETREPQPPRIPNRDPITIRFDRTNLVPNYDDPAWMQRVKAIHQHRTAMYFDAALMFKVPGGNYMEKYRWISARLIGDVIRLKKYIEKEIVGLAGDLDFF